MIEDRTAIRYVTDTVCVWHCHHTDADADIIPRTSNIACIGSCSHLPRPVDVNHHEAFLHLCMEYVLVQAEQMPLRLYYYLIITVNN